MRLRGSVTEAATQQGSESSGTMATAQFLHFYYLSFLIFAAKQKSWLTSICTLRSNKVTENAH